MLEWVGLILFSLSFHNKSPAPFPTGNKKVPVRTGPKDTRHLSSDRCTVAHAKSTTTVTQTKR